MSERETQDAKLEELLETFAGAVLLPYSHEAAEIRGASKQALRDHIAKLRRAPSAPAQTPEQHEFAIEEAALAVMQFGGGPGVPARDVARVAVEGYLRGLAIVTDAVLGTPGKEGET